MTIDCIVLIGPPGSGKTVAGQMLARKLGWEFLDTDNLIEEQVKFTIPEIFQEYGEATFRHLECCLLEDLAEKKSAQVHNADKRDLDNDQNVTSGLIIATGGGMPVAPGNFERLTLLGPVVFLTASMPKLVARLKDTANRPLLANKSSKQAVPVADISQRLGELYKQREPIYSRTRYKIDTTDLNPDAVADEVLEILGMSG